MAHFHDVGGLGRRRGGRSAAGRARSQLEASWKHRVPLEQHSSLNCQNTLSFKRNHKPQGSPETQRFKRITMSGRLLASATPGRNEFEMESDLRAGKA